ncbi:MAG: hypothetical protein NZ899_14520 [Thermoguttaceae bacterium]|nr:hypothetical protein [Thermoguttaceae bacterium]MDW8080036.1 hypothetical protein [Thermoguttaceae bacterium]
MSVRTALPNLVPFVSAWAIILASPAEAQVCQIRVLTDASPDFSDIPSFIRSATGAYASIEEKCWALFYWVHIARRQTSPMIMHGLEVTDPIRQFNDLGYTMCSTVAGINCALWHHMGLPVRFWDVTLHTVSECFYDGRWHMYDNSMSAIYTLCDGKTIAGVEDLGKELGCTASGGRVEPGHVVKYHCLTATSANGFLTGADCARDLDQEARCFHTAGLKLRTYYNNWEWGHRYVINLREGESYTRYYRSLGNGPEFYVPNHGKDPESVNPRYRLRGNGVWMFRPKLSPESFPRVVYESKNVLVGEDGTIRPASAGREAEAVFKINAGNIATSQVIRAEGRRGSPNDRVEIWISVTAGLSWQCVYKADEAGTFPIEVKLIEPVNGAYEILVKFALFAAADSASVGVGKVEIETRTMLNSKTQPHLRLGLNTVHVDAGEPVEPIVLWPDLQGEAYRQFVVEEVNIATEREHPGWRGVMFAREPNKEAYTVYKIRAPRPIKRIVYGGRFYNRAPGAQIQLLHSFDGGRSWQLAWTLTETEQPWDDIHYVTVDDIPPDTREVLFKYLLRARQAGSMACSMYSVRMEVQHEVADPVFRPFDVTFTWEEIQPDRSRVRRSHTQRIDRVPFVYTIDVGGTDHPVVESLEIASCGQKENVRYGYSDDRPGLGKQVIDFWQELGTNLLQGKPYTLSHEPNGAWGGDDPARRKLTDGVVGSNYAGGTAMQYAAGFDEKMGTVDITVDLGVPQKIAALGIHLTAGWPWWDALQGEVRDEVDAFLSPDGKEFVYCGTFNLNLFRRDIPINHMLPDDEKAQAWNYVLPLPERKEAQLVRFRLRPKRIVGVTEVQAWDHLERRPFKLKILLPEKR